MINKATVKMPSRGYYSLKKVDASGNSRPLGVAVDNVITYAGAYFSLIDDGLFEKMYAAVGTGSTERDRDSTGLGADESGRSSYATANRGGNEVDNGDGTSTLTLVRELPFGMGDKVGTYSEVGLFSASSGGTFVAGQLIKDEFGDPTTITVLADEQLIVTYTLEWTVPNTGNMVGTGTVTDSDLNSYQYEVWAAPYFTRYDVIGSGTTSKRYPGWRGIALCDSEGDLLLAANEASSKYATWSHTLGAGGVVTITSFGKVFAPADFSATGVVYCNLGGRSIQETYNRVLDSGGVVLPRSGGYLFTNNAIVKFLTPLDKTNTQTFQLQVELEVQV